MFAMLLSLNRKEAKKTYFKIQITGQRTNKNMNQEAHEVQKLIFIITF